MIAESDERDKLGRTVLRDVSFEGATFQDPVSFVGLAFEGKTRFDGARFADRVSFEDVGFADDVSFNNVVFVEPAHFAKTTFSTSVSFNGAQAQETISFVGAVFAGEASFGGVLRGARFSGDRMFAGTTLREANFSHATFEGDQLFLGAVFEQDATFTGASFTGEYPFYGAAFASGGTALFNHARFDALRSFGPILVPGTLGLYRACFMSYTRLEVSANMLFAAQTQFLAGAELRAAPADIALDATLFAGPSLVVGVNTSLGPPARSLLRGWLGIPFGPATEPSLALWDKEKIVLLRWGQRPRLLSLRAAEVGKLALSNLDLQACRFEGALGLDNMRIEPTCTFASTPPGRYSIRDVIAEEHEWRYHRGQKRQSQSGAWYGVEVRGSQRSVDLLGEPERLRPEQIASIYRQLRKAREDSKDQPGAADFYYGEMEMRRHTPLRTESRAGARLTSRGEHVLLSLYWLTSGYGLRASRALAALAVTVLAFAVLLFLFGLKTPDFGTALLQSAEGATLRSGDQELLTGVGKGLQLALRLLGPVFFGLAVLSLRGRVQR
jgi:uncharacterized protein YjbI with pentapeptide repeats